MNIGFSARGLSVHSGGVRQFIKSLIPALAAQIQDDNLFVFYNHPKFLGLAPNCSEILIKGDNRIWWDFVLLPRVMRKFGIDAAIFPKNVVPFFAGCRSFVVIHDLAYFNNELGAYPFLDTMYMRTLIPTSVRRATGVFAVSKHTKRDIIRYTGCNPDKIIVTYEAADKIYRIIKDSTILHRVRNKYKLPDEFIMYAGSLSPRKNVIRLLEAFAALQGKIPHHLVFTASKSWKDTDVYDAIQRLNLADRIHKLGYVEENDMPVLYNLAAVYVYPSLYEGFGLPILEAMQCGCPVVASNATSIPEVAGDAALLVDPHDTMGFTEAIYRVINDKKFREQLVLAGLCQAEKFSWHECARRMLKTIRNLAN